MQIYTFWAAITPSSLGICCNITWTYTSDRQLWAEHLTLFEALIIEKGYFAPEQIPLRPKSTDCTWNITQWVVKSCSKASTWVSKFVCCRLSLLKPDVMYCVRLELTEKQMDTAHSYCSGYMLPVTVKKTNKPSFILDFILNGSKVYQMNTTQHLICMKRAHHKLFRKLFIQS